MGELTKDLPAIMKVQKELVEAISQKNISAGITAMEDMVKEL